MPGARKKTKEGRRTEIGTENFFAFHLAIQNTLMGTLILGGGTTV